MDEKSKKRYSEYVEKVTPTHNVWLQMLKAYVVGGVICVLGQGINHFFTAVVGYDKDTTGICVTIILVLLAVIMTALNLYPKITKFAGAGALVPITGFANSVAAPAIEFKKEGWVFGVGCKIFTIAGPVILYGILTSWALGLIYWGLKVLGVV